MNKHIKKRARRNKRLKMRKYIKRLPLEVKLKYLGITLDKWFKKWNPDNG